MKKLILPLAILLLVAAGCTNSSFITSILSTANLTVQEFSIHITRDTTIKTSEGIIINIPANSIKADGNTVTLQVKEALTVADMLKAGLTTQAGKEILSSDGMFFIGTKEQSTIKGALHIKLPTLNANKKMQLYKGMEQNGKIDWQNPAPVAKTITPFADSGEVLFKTNCTACHAIDKKLTGPALAWMDKRKNREWMHAYIRNNQKVLASGDKYANCVLCQYKSAMTVFNFLSDRDIDAMCRYVDKMSKEEGLPENFGSCPECDSCDYYHAYYDNLQIRRDSLMRDNSQMATLHYNLPGIVFETTYVSRDTSQHVAVPRYDAEYYQFDINSFGWYNLDYLLKKWDRLPESNLTVKLTGEHTDRVNIYLAVPALKIFAEGGFLQNGTDFGFEKDNGKTRLPQNTDAWIIGVSEQNEKLYYTEKHFITALSQDIEISLAETDRAKLLASFHSLGLDKTNMTVEKTKNFDGMKAVDAELQKLQNKLSNCACEDRARGLDTAIIEKK